MKCTIPEISWHNRDPVLSLDIQPKKDIDDGPLRLATGGTDSHVLIWHVSIQESGKTTVEFAADLQHHQRAVNAVRFSPSGELLASGDDESAIIIWKQKTDQDVPEFPNNETEVNKEQWLTVRMLRGHMEDVYDLSWSKDSTQLISGSVDNTAILWDVQKGKKQGILSDHTGFVQGVAWDPKNQYVATLSSDRTCRVYSLATKKAVSRVSKARLPVPDGSELDGKVVRLFHDDTLKSFFRRLSFSPDGEILVAPSGLIEMPGSNTHCNATFLFTRSVLNRPVVYLPSPDQYTVAVRFCPLLFELRDIDSIFALPYRMVLAVATQSSVVLYDTQQAEPFGIISNIHYTRLTDMSWSSDGRILIVSSTDGYCSIITFAAGELGHIYQPKDESSQVTSEDPQAATELSSDTVTQCKDTKPQSTDKPLGAKTSVNDSSKTAESPSRKPIKRICPISVKKSPQRVCDRDRPTTDSKVLVKDSDRPTPGSGVLAKDNDQPTAGSGVLAKDSDRPTTGSGVLAKDSDRPTTGSSVLTKDSDLPTTDSGVLVKDSDRPTTGSGVLTKDNDQPTTDSGVLTKDNDQPTTDSGVLAKDSDRSTTGSGVLAKDSDRPTTDSGVLAKDSDRSTVGSKESVQSTDTGVCAKDIITVSSVVIDMVLSSDNTSEVKGLAREGDKVTTKNKNTDQEKCLESTDNTESDTNVLKTSTMEVNDQVSVKTVSSTSSTNLQDEHDLKMSQKSPQSNRKVEGLEASAESTIQEPTSCNKINNDSINSTSEMISDSSLKTKEETLCERMDSSDNLKVQICSQSEAMETDVEMAPCNLVPDSTNNAQSQEREPIKVPEMNVDGVHKSTESTVNATILATSQNTVTGGIDRILPSITTREKEPTRSSTPDPTDTVLCPKPVNENTDKCKEVTSRSVSADIDTPMLDDTNKENSDIRETQSAVKQNTTSETTDKCQEKLLSTASTITSVHEESPSKSHCTSPQHTSETLQTTPRKASQESMEVDEVSQAEVKPCNLTPTQQSKRTPRRVKLITLASPKSKFSGLNSE